MSRVRLRSGTRRGVGMADDDDDIVEDNTDAAESDATDPEVVDESATVDAPQKRESTRANGLRVSVSVRTLLVTALIAALLASIGVLAWLYLGEKAQLDQQARQTANNRHAEQIALDYAVDAAKINYQDLGAWKKDLVKGTTRELTDKLNGAAKSMEQILEPLQWNSTATPLIAKVRSDSNGIYIVDTFVSVETKTIQALEGLQSTATYSITIDSNHNWEISEVGGIGAVIEHK
jgi:Mce-associated membrane protein